MRAVVAHGGKGETGGLPDVHVLDLGGAHVELGSEPVEDRLDDLALLLQGARPLQSDGDLEHAYKHLQRTFLLFERVELERVLFLEVFVALEADAALEALLDLLGVVLETPERLQAQVVHDDDAVADQARA